MQLPFSVENLEKVIGQGLDPDYIYMSRELTSEPRIEWVRMATGRDDSGKAKLLGQPVMVHPLRTGEFLFQRREKLAEGVELRAKSADEQSSKNTE